MKAFFWIDMEMTGLDEKSDSILEVAVVVTNTDFETLEEYSRVVCQPSDALERMSGWCKKTHKKSGLIDEVKNGSPLNVVEEEILQIVDRHFEKSDQIVLAGNSVGNDKRFIEKYMPSFAKRLHYRIIDISSFKELFKKKYGIEFAKKDAHRAMKDILESIAELKVYVGYIKIPQSAPKNAP